MYVFVFVCILVLILSQYREPFTPKDVVKAVTTNSAVDTLMNPIEGIGKRVRFYIPFKKEFYSIKRYFRRR